MTSLMMYGSGVFTMAAVHAIAIHEYTLGGCFLILAGITLEFGAGRVKL